MPLFSAVPHLSQLESFQLFAGRLGVGMRWPRPDQLPTPSAQPTQFLASHSGIVCHKLTRTMSSTNANSIVCVNPRLGPTAPACQRREPEIGRRWSAPWCLVLYTQGRKRGNGFDPVWRKKSRKRSRCVLPMAREADRREERMWAGLALGAASKGGPRRLTGQEQRRLVRSRQNNTVSDDDSRQSQY